jgi:hypothetical protein
MTLRHVRKNSGPWELFENKRTFRQDHEIRRGKIRNDQLGRPGGDSHDCRAGPRDRTAELKQKEAQLAVLVSKIEDLEAKHAYFETVAARLEGLELRQNHSIQTTVETSLSLLLQGE